MTKYARKVGPHWVDVWRVPEDFADIAKLNACLPGGGFLAVDAGVLPGALHNNGDGSAGTYTNPPPPPPPPPPQPIVLKWGDLAIYLIGLLGGGATGRAALGAIIKACTASAQGADNFFAVYFQGQTVFSKAEFTAVLADVSAGIVSGPAKTAVTNNWPEA